MENSSTYLLLIFVFVLFLAFSGGMFVFWKNKEPLLLSTKDSLHAPLGTPQDAVLGEWVKGSCEPYSGKCGKGTMSITRKCIKDGSNGGITCSDPDNTKSADCWLPCSRPEEIVDWGHPNNAVNRLPLKGWYDFTGSGEPNDYCRWVGEAGKVFWSCYTPAGEYIKANPDHITFSAGPANKLDRTWDVNKVQRMCPQHSHYIRATDTDLQKSIQNKFFDHCGSKCIYDYRNPSQGWMWNDKEYIRIDDMKKHTCGTLHKNEMQKAVDQYDKVFETKNSWSI